MRIAGNGSRSNPAAVLRMLAAAVLAAVVLTSCVYEDPHQKEFYDDLQNEFETEDYFNP